jgi:phenylalanyl-tRNA synthetase beta chain
MQISEAWLRELVNPPLTTEQLVEQITMAGLEVDSVTPAAAEFCKVVVAEVVSIQPHPNADKLKVCQVDVGEGESIQIVCGASNVREGMKVPAALVGAKLPGDFKIKKSKLRGEVSLGMLCSEKELGLADEASGLMELPADAPVGEDIRTYLALDDQCIEVDLTPNRADCLSVEGIAREVAVLNKMDWQPLVVDPVAVVHQQTVAVQVEQADKCPRYLGRLIKNVNYQAQTPIWMQERLRRSGLRSLGPLVDVTNYVLLEMGQPLHAFDADKIDGAIVVRNSHKGEKLDLLNDQTITLDDNTLVIADQNQALALAGVMGGSRSAVSETTQHIFLECAFFNPVAIAGKARQYGLHTDSSHRFERGVDFTLQSRAIERATQLILDIAGGEAGPVTEVVDEASLPKRLPVSLRPQRIKKILGIELPEQDVSDIFTRLGMRVIADNDGWKITPPGFRFDIAIEADLLEEIGRIYGYNNLPNSQLLLRSELGKAPEALLPLDRIKDLLVDLDYQEAITYSFVDEDSLKRVAPDEQPVRLKNPISQDMAVMRTTLWCGLLNAAAYNTKRQQNRVRLFETGLSFVQKNGEIVQQAKVAGLTLGNIFPEQWGEKNRKTDFFDIKADVEALFALTGFRFNVIQEAHPALHPGQSAKIVNNNGEFVGWLGMLHPELEKPFGFDSNVFLFELDLDRVQKKVIPAFTPLSKFPSVRRDMALLVEEGIQAADLLKTVLEAGFSKIQDVQLFDIYQGPGVEKGYKSIALSLILQDFDQTLTDSEIDAIFNGVLEVLGSKLKAKLRD